MKYSFKNRKVCCDMSFHYERLRKIGRGTYSTVYFGRDTEDDHEVALKKMKLFDPSEGICASTIREIALLKMLSHPNIVRLENVYICTKHSGELDKMYLILEYIEKDLRRIITIQNHVLDSKIVKGYMHQLLKGLEFCHSHNVIHRDLKPENLLVDASGNLKICDFGLSRTISACDMTPTVVTLNYRAPEILLGQKDYSLPIDIWSVGCIFGELSTLNILFKGDSEMDQIGTIFITLGTPTSEVWPGIEYLPYYSSGLFPGYKSKDLKTVVQGIGDLGLDLLCRMLKYAPSERITAAEALQHPYFDDVNT